MADLIRNLLNLPTTGDIVERRSDVASALSTLGYDWKRESGADLADFKRGREELALFNPQQFVQSRNQRITDAEIEADAVAKDTYSRFVNEFRYPTDMAKKVASQSAMAQLSIRLAEIEAMYGQGQLSEAKRRPVVNIPNAGDGGEGSDAGSVVDY